MSLLWRATAAAPMLREREGRQVPLPLAARGEVGASIDGRFDIPVTETHSNTSRHVHVHLVEEESLSARWIESAWT